MHRFTFALTNHVAQYLATYPHAAELLGPLAAHPELTLAAVCDRHGRIPGQVHFALAMGCRLEPQNAHGTDWSQYGIGELIDHVLATHHPFLTAELGRFELLVAHTPASPVLRQRIAHWAAELFAHIEHEEVELFPLCRRFETSRRAAERPVDGDPESELHGMYRGHEDSESELVTICNGISDLTADTLLLANIRKTLEDLITDLHVHVDLEDGVLLPAVLFAQELEDTRRFRKSRALRALTPKSQAQ